MVIGYGTLTLRLEDNHSLKEKRRVVKSVIGQIRNHFNASVAETAKNDLHHEAEIGFAMVGNSRQVINSKMDQLANMVDDLGVAQLVDSEMEIMHL